MEAAADRATAYAEAVVAGELPAGRKARLACERHLRDLEEGEARGLRWDVAAAEHAINFFPTFLTHYKGAVAGLGFELEPWQCFVVGSLFGWKRRATGRLLANDRLGGWVRRFRMAYVEVPRKNGKTTLAAGIGLLLAFADGEAGAEVYSAATKRDQAKLCHTAAKNMVAANRSLRRRIKAYAHSLVRHDNHSVFVALGRDADTMDGLDVHGAVIDELHRHKDGGVVDVLDTATGARRQPLIFMITTAGSSKATTCGQYHEDATAILQGAAEDDRFFAYIAGIDQGEEGEEDGDDWTDPAAWAKANPSMAILSDSMLEDLQAKCQKALRQPVWRNAFLRLHCGVWTGQDGGWLPMPDFDQCRGQVPWDQLAGLLRGERCFGGLDLSSKKDFSAWVLVFPPNEDRAEPLEADAWYVVTRCWLPEYKLEERANELKQPVVAWRDMGGLTATEGRVIDYREIKRQILADAEAYELEETGYDPYMAEQLVLELQEEGLELVPVRQGFLSLSAPSKELEAQLIGHLVRHGGQPVLRWMADRVVASTDDADNIKPSKKKSADRIDLIAAWVNALHRATAGQEDEMSMYATETLAVTGS